jgi:hypothetical protein
MAGGFYTKKRRGEEKAFVALFFRVKKLGQSGALARGLWFVFSQGGLDDAT